MTDSVFPARLRWPVYLLLAFPIVDYFLDIYPWGIVTKAWYYLLLIFLAMYTMRVYMTEGRRQLFPSHRMILFLAMLGLVYVVMDTDYLAVAFDGYRVDYMYMLFAVLLPYIVDKDDVLQYLKFMVATGLLIAMHGIYQYITAAPVAPGWIPIGEHMRTRVYSLFGSPNILGSYMAFIIPTAIGLALYVKQKGERLFFIGTAIASFMSLVFTENRGPLLAEFVGLLVLTWLIDKRLFLPALLLAALAFFVPQIHSRFEQLLSPVYWSQTFENGRIARWASAYDQMRANPLFGAGLGRFGGATASRYFGTIYVDNYYAKTLAEVGLIGLLAFLWLLFVYLRDVWRVWKKTLDPRVKFVIAGVFSSLVVVVAHNGVENVFEDNAMNTLFWVAGTLVLIYGSEEAKRHG